jgi:TonB family protein
MRTAKLISAVLIGSLFVAVSSDAGAASKRKKAKPDAPKMKPSEIFSAHLYLNRYKSGENLMQSCKRANFSFLTMALHMNADWLDVPKGEFETTDQYKEREAKLEKLMGENQVIVCEPTWDNPDIQLTYNADAQVFSGSFQRNHNVWRESKALGSYVSKTRMGVRATVKSSLEMNYDISLQLPNELKGCLAGSYGSLSFSAPAARDTAPGIKRLGRLVIVGQLVSPYIRTEDEDGNPTLDNPYDVYGRTFTLSLKPTRIVLIGTEGEEVWSCKPGKFNPSPNPTPIGEKSNWISANDYPMAAYRDRKTGRVRAILSVGPNGAVTDCTIAESSGSNVLDSETCAVLHRRARFTPAADQGGEPIQSSYEMSVNWSLPL